MCAYVTALNHNISIDVFISFIKFKKASHCEHTITFLLSNEDTEPVSEILLVYPTVLPEDGESCKSGIHTFKEFPDEVCECDVIDSIVIREYKDAFPDSRFDAKDGRLKGHSYRSLLLDKIRYEGFVTLKPILSRSKVGIDFLRDANESGFSLFTLKLPEAFPLQKGIPQWFRLQINNNTNPGFLNYLCASVNNNPFDHVITDPITIKNNLMRLLSQSTTDGAKRQDIDQLRNLLGCLLQKNCNTNVKRFIFYTELDNVELRSAISCKAGSTYVTPITIPAKRPCYKIAVETIGDSQNFQSVTISVHTKERATAAVIFSPLIRLFRLFSSTFTV